MKHEFICRPSAICEGSLDGIQGGGWLEHSIEPHVRLGFEVFRELSFVANYVKKYHLRRLSLTWYWFESFD